MAVPIRVADLVDLELDGTQRFAVLDPGNTCGTASIDPLAHEWIVQTCTLDRLLGHLGAIINLDRPRFVACEDFSLTGGNRRNDPKVPAAVGIGMARALCWEAGVPFVLVPRHSKRAGQCALDDDGKAARSCARNDHKRDVIDLAGFVLRELRVAAHNARR